MGNIEEVPKRKTKFIAAIPASFVSDIPHLREKTYRAGIIGRVASIFRVDELLIYPDILKTDQSKEAKFLQKILTYLETPQYLRRKMFSLSEELKYVGILPPLRAPHHLVADNVKIGEFREGIIVGRKKIGMLVYVGAKKLVLIPEKFADIGRRVTVKILAEDEKYIYGKLADPQEISIYWGYKVSISRKPLGRLLKEMNGYLKIATSRYGRPINDVVDTLKERINSTKNVLIAFGSPSMGLKEILMQENMSIEDIFDFCINTIPSQGVKTVRTEEAMLATFSILNILT